MLEPFYLSCVCICLFQEEEDRRGKKMGWVEYFTLINQFFPDFENQLV